MARSKWKLLFFPKSIWRIIHFYHKKKFFKNRSTFYDRSSNIPFCFNFKIIKVHKGYFSSSLGIAPIFLSKKLGEFSFTRKPYHFPLKKKKAKK